MNSVAHANQITVENQIKEDGMINHVNPAILIAIWVLAIVVPFGCFLNMVMICYFNSLWGANKGTKTERLIYHALYAGLACIFLYYVALPVCAAMNNA